MVRVITMDDVRNLVRKLTLNTIFLRLADSLEYDFSNWSSFKLEPRLATHFPHGVIELMPVCNQEYYSFKYVNGHPGNPKDNKSTVVAIGMLADIESGYPVLISEMTLLTALRTATISAVASKYLAHKGAKTFGMIGTGAQSEFQVLAHHYILGVNQIYYYDIDAKAMQKFENNLAGYDLHLHRCEDVKSVIKHSEIITTATADKRASKIIDSSWLQKGVHLNAIGGDCPGKTEIDPELTARAKVVVELLDQTKTEGEIQHLAGNNVHAELWEIIVGQKPGREAADEITLFDSVGFALEDYSVLRLIYALAEEYQIGHVLDLLPDSSDPKDLFSLLN